MRGDKKALRDGSLISSDTFEHGGAGGVCLSIDPVNEVILAYFLCPDPSRTKDWLATMARRLFANATIAAIEDG